VTLDAFTELAGGFDHPEGIAWGPDGFLYAGGEAGQVYRVGLDGSAEEIASTGEARPCDTPRFSSGCR
jgi:gluconolactonase